MTEEVATVAAMQPRSGQRIGSYVLEEQIGAGAFAEVWRGRHHVLKDKVAAFKIPTNEEYLRNLQKEGVIQHNVRHPNIVQTLDLDPWHDPPYLMMEHVDGRSLRDLLDEKKRLPHQEAVRITCAVLEALDAAHRHDVIHRDMKPENILLDGDGAVKVSDFGLGLATENTSLSLSVSLGSTDDARKIVGTLDYMAPEQRRNGETSPQSDIYSVGVVLYEMLTGTLPVGRFKMPSEIDPEIPATVDRAVDWALSTTPTDRAESARVLMGALREAPNRRTSAPAVSDEQPPTQDAVAIRLKTRPASTGLPVYEFEAMGKDGKELKDEIRAVNPEDAISRIRALGHFPTSVPRKKRQRDIPTCSPLFDLALTDFRHGRAQQAIERLQKVSEDPATKEGAVSCAVILARRARRKRRLEDALKFYGFALQHSKAPEIREERGWVLVQAGKCTQAANVFEKLIEEDPTNPDLKRGYHAATSRDPVWQALRSQRRTAHIVLLSILAVVTFPIMLLVLSVGEDGGMVLFSLVMITVWAVVGGVCSLRFSHRRGDAGLYWRLVPGSICIGLCGAMLVMLLCSGLGLGPGASVPAIAVHVAAYVLAAWFTSPFFIGREKAG